MVSGPPASSVIPTPPPEANIGANRLFAVSIYSVI
jgi:hypothetical protein